jgi:hypothetical protein
MKLATIVCLAALAAGCSAGQTAPEAPATPEREASVDEVIAIPAADELPPGSMDFDWQPTEIAAPKKPRPRGYNTTPEFVAPIHAKGRLVTLPTKREN